MGNIVEVHLADDSRGEGQHIGKKQFFVSHVVPLASYSWLFSMYMQA